MEPMSRSAVFCHRVGSVFAKTQDGLHLMGILKERDESRRPAMNAVSAFNRCKDHSGNEARPKSRILRRQCTQRFQDAKQKATGRMQTRRGRTRIKQNIFFFFSFILLSPLLLFLCSFILFSPSPCLLSSCSPVLFSRFPFVQTPLVVEADWKFDSRGGQMLVLVTE